MGLDEIRDRARAQVHDAFAIPAVVTSPDGLVVIAVTARLHRDLKKPFGDLDREGFAMVLEFQNQIIVDRAEWPEPKRGWTIDFGRGRVYKTGPVVGEKGEQYVRVEVT